MRYPRALLAAVVSVTVALGRPASAQDALARRTQHQYQVIVRDWRQMTPVPCSIAFNGRITLYCTSYFAHDALRLVLLEGRIGERRLQERHYYDQRGGLFFVVSRWWPCPRGRCVGNGAVERVYFQNGMVVRWLGAAVRAQGQEDNRTKALAVLESRAFEASVRAWRARNAGDASARGDAATDPVDHAR